jgi:hypothetical protein
MNLGQKLAETPGISGNAWAIEEIFYFSVLFVENQILGNSKISKYYL